MCEQNGIGAPNPRDYAIVVGIEDYGDASLGSLKGAKLDAQGFARWACDPQGGGIPCAQVSLILSTAGPPQATPPAQQVADAFISLLQAVDLQEQKIGRRLYVFFAGHGAGNPEDLDEVGLLPASFSRFSNWYLVGLQYVKDMQRLAAFDEVFLFMDCCRDELPRAVRPFPLAIDFKNDPAAANVRLFVGYATTHGSKAREREFDGKVRGVFSYALLEALKSGNTWVGDVLTAQRLVSYVEDHVLQYRPDGSRQEARFPYDARGIEISRRPGSGTSKTRVRVELSKPESAFHVYFGGDLATPLPLAITTTAPNVAEFELDAGQLYLFGVPQGDGSLFPTAYQRVDGAEVTLVL